MRTVSGEIVLPANAPSKTAKQVLIEVRDVTMADAPSVVIAEQQFANVALKPGGRIAFKLSVPEVASNRSLSVRAHLSIDGSGRAQSGDLLTTASYPVPNAGTPPPLKVQVNVI